MTPLASEGIQVSRGPGIYWFRGVLWERQSRQGRRARPSPRSRSVRFIFLPSSLHCMALPSCCLLRHLLPLYFVCFQPGLPA